MPAAAMLWCVLLLVLNGHGVGAQRSDSHSTQADLNPFPGSDRYDFSIVMPGSGMECFWHYARQGGSFYLISMVQWVTGMASEHRLFVTVFSPDGVLMASTNELISQIIFDTPVTGFYQMCLLNQHNRFGRVRVFLNFGVYYEDFEQRDEEEEEKALNTTLYSIEASVWNLQADILHMWRHYNYARMTKAADHHLLLSNLSYVTWWSAAQCLVIILAGCLQLLFLKRLFYTEPEKPRC